MSWVFLTEQYAYKLKKPIVTSLLDFRTGAARRAACEEELRLNRRLAPNVYLAVVPLVQTRSGWRVEDEGDAVDWLVKMRRLPRASMLDARIAAGSIPSTELDRLADVLSAFYARAERAPATSADYCERLSADIRSKRGSLALPRYALPRDEIEALVAALSGWMSRHQVSLEQRATSIVEAHGDLRPEHISLESEPTVIDCLEFDRSLRLLDPLSELSFLALECRRLGAPWACERVLERYMEQSGVSVPRSLLAFYSAHHALVRAAVAIWHLDDDGLLRDDGFRARALTYLRLGCDFLP